MTSPTGSPTGLVNPSSAEQTKQAGQPAVLLSIKSAAARLGIGKDLLYKLVALDEFPHYKIGTRIRILDTDIDRWLETQKRGAASFNGSSPTGAAKDGSTSTRIQ